MDHIVTGFFGHPELVLPSGERPQVLGDEGLALDAVQRQLVASGTNGQDRIDQEVALTTFFVPEDKHVISTFLGFLISYHEVLKGYDGL